MRTGLCSCLSLLQQGNETMADRLLVPVPHEQTHTPRSIFELAGKLGSDLSETLSIKHTMELIAHSFCIANGALAKVAREGWPDKMALLNGQSMGPESELHQSLELTDAHWQLMMHDAVRTESLQREMGKLQGCHQLFLHNHSGSLPFRTGPHLAP